jgi:FkbM family methyltransferase
MWARPLIKLQATVLLHFQTVHMYNANVVQPLYSNKIFSAAFRMYELFKLSLTPAIKKDSNSKEYLPYILDAVAKGYTVLDIGAHKKSCSFDLNKISKLPGRLVVFETNAMIYNYLQKLKHLMHFENIIIEHFSAKDDLKTGAGSAKKTDGITGATVIDFNSRITKEGNNVTAKGTLDYYCSIKFIIPALIKFKLNGNDLTALQGAKEIIRKYKPQVLIECSEGKTSRETLTSTFKLLSDLHYKGYFILDTIKVPLANFDFNTYQNEVLGFYCNNFIFE